MPADSILAVTFTNKAAAEMAERVERLMDHRSLARPLLSTFHSFCVRVLRRDIEALRHEGRGRTKDFVIYDETEQQALVKQAMRRLGLDDKQLTPRTVLSRISWAKNHMLDPQEIYLQSQTQRTSASPISTTFTPRNWSARTPSTSTICCSKRCVSLRSSAEVRGYYNRRLPLHPHRRIPGHQPPAI